MSERYVTTARNFSVNTENRIHSDEIAARFGFEGALVPGAAVFGIVNGEVATEIEHTSIFRIATPSVIERGSAQDASTQRRWSVWQHKRQLPGKAFTNTPIGRYGLLQQR